VSWNEPPPEVRREMNRILGEDIYLRAQRAWERARQADPDVILESWFRTPARQRELGGATYSQHPLGTAVDLVQRDAAKRAAIVEALRREGFWVQERGRRVHVQAIHPEWFQRVLPQILAAGLYR